MSKQNRRAEVLVAGGGLAGFCAALSAAEAGAEVTLIEKASSYGGSTVQSGGGFAFAGTEAQKALGVEDSVDLLRADLMKCGNGKNDPDLTDVYVERQLDAYEWLQRHGVEFGPVTLASSMSVPRAHSVDPRQMMEALRKRISQVQRIAYRTECAAQRIRPGRSHDDPVTVAVCAKDGPFEFCVTSGVVIATGGFTQSEELIDRYAPHLRAALRGGGEANTGDGFLMGLALGADHRDVGYLKGTFGFSLNSYLGTARDDRPILIVSMYDGSIIVNRAAKRFVNESISYKEIGEACLKQPEAVGFQILDGRIMAMSKPVPNPCNYDLAEKNGLMVRADTLAELAERLRIDPQIFEQTVVRYNDDIRAGIDTEFGRASLSGNFGVPPTIEKPPFYGYPCATALIASYCGLAVDRAMRLVNPYGEHIPRVFAAGEVVGGFHGQDYSSGSALGKAAIFGRLAGGNAAATTRAK
ncbi:FAD-dependent oxidoreductase [Bradyrhizobium commune]|uniref:FAD-dependent oxidoreductase n=1 Tax=Bradyrhizobium commune TaxID=83627 RepID=A0A7S9GZB0_9BRAD|nr:FAD-dependent oxidoreductase [Bradyrhizobium commune]QPF90706.1 FAD-dependent oxidoreductase [Bradyrhizobium commune]